MSRSIKASEFKAKCLKLMDEVAESGDAIVITKHGKPLVELAPFRRKPRHAFGALKGYAEVHGDIVSPVDVEWDAQK